MDYLLLGIILFLLFSLLILIIVSNAYREWEKDLQTNPRSHEEIKKLTERDILYRYIQKYTRRFQSFFDTSNDQSQKANPLQTYIIEPGISIFSTFVGFISNLLSFLRPIKQKEGVQKQQIFYDEREELSDSIITDRVIDEPNIMLDQGVHKRGETRRNPRKSVQSDDHLTREEFEKLEASLLYKFEREKGDRKFKLALELANLYGTVGMIEEEKQLYSWILEKGNDESKAIASRHIIGM